MFEERLRRALNGETLRAFARRTGIPHSTLRRYESGTQPSLDKAVEIAAALRVRLEWLATGEGPMRPGDVLMPVHGLGWDAALMHECIREVEGLLLEMEKEMDPTVKADFVLDLYRRELEKRQQGQHLSAPEKIRLLKQAG
jgi:transcriptional regulator with XRE-family HTH domain